MVGFTGWIGALFMFGFLWLALETLLRSRPASLVAGLVVCGVAALIFRSPLRKDFAHQFGLAISFAGQALFIHGLADLFRLQEDWVGYLAFATFETVLVFVVNNAIHRTASTVSAVVAIGLALSSIGARHLAPGVVSAGFVVVWLNELEWARRGSIVRPIGYGLVLAAFLVNGALLGGEKMWPVDSIGDHASNLAQAFNWAGALLNGAVFLSVVFRLIARESRGPAGPAVPIAMAAAVAVALTSFTAPGVVTALSVVLLGHANGNRVLTGFGIFAFIAYVGAYYYQMDTTLLVKSGALAATGVVLLAARFALCAVPPTVSPDERRDA
jgi:hypothetical protein